MSGCHNALRCWLLYGSKVDWEVHNGENAGLGARDDEAEQEAQLYPTTEWRD